MLHQAGSYWNLIELVVPFLEGDSTASQNGMHGHSHAERKWMTKHLCVQGDLLPGTPTLNATAEICCEACWIYFDPASGTQCDVWVLDSKTGVCQLKNSTAASEFQAVPANRGSSYSSYTSGESRDQICNAVRLNLRHGVCSSARALQHI